MKFVLDGCGNYGVCDGCGRESEPTFGCGNNAASAEVVGAVVVISLCGCSGTT